MARLEISGLDELDRVFRELGNVPDDVTERACKAGAEVAAAKIKQTGESKRIRSREGSAHILDRIKVGKFKKTDGGGYVDITFSGTQKKTKGSKPVSNGRVAFENEYGNSTQSARPFVGPAIASNEDAIVRPMADAIGDFMESTWNK